MRQRGSGGASGGTYAIVTAGPPEAYRGEGSDVSITSRNDRDEALRLVPPRFH